MQPQQGGKSGAKTAALLRERLPTQIGEAVEQGHWVVRKNKGCGSKTAVEDENRLSWKRMSMHIRSEPAPLGGMEYTSAWLLGGRCSESWEEKTIASTKSHGKLQCGFNK